MNAAFAAEIKRLSPAEKLELVEELWDSLAADEDQLPIPESHKRALEEDRAKYEADPKAGAPWPEVKRRITGTAGARA